MAAKKLTSKKQNTVSKKKKSIIADPAPAQETQTEKKVNPGTVAREAAKAAGLKEVRSLFAKEDHIPVIRALVKALDIMENGDTSKQEHGITITNNTDSSIRIDSVYQSGTGLTWTLKEPMFVKPNGGTRLIDLNEDTCDIV